MKMTRKIATVLFIVFLASIWTAYAGYTIYSNIVTVDANHVFTLSQSLSNSEVTLTARLMKTGSPVPSASINFSSCNIDGGSLSLLGTATTNATGYAVYKLNLTTNGTFYYIAGYDVP